MMRNFRQIFIIFLMLTLAVGRLSLEAQTIVNPETEYARIRSLALEGSLTEAEPAARLLVKEYPEYGDARIVLGRIIAWQGRYDEAAAVIDTLLLTEPDNADALEALADIRRWSRDRSQQVTSPTDLRAGYLFDTYREPYDRFWQVFSLGAGHRFPWGTGVGTINWGHVNIGPPDRQTGNDFQVAAEAWPELTKKNYAYLGYAFSPGSWFPKHRAALEVWQALPAGWEISAGVNYYYFDHNIFLATASVEKYLGNYWFSGRGYLHFKDIGITTSFFITARRYYRVTDYLQLTLGTGTAPDEPYDIITDLERQKATSVRIAWFTQINSLWSLRLGAGYSYEKYDPAGWRSRFEGNIGLIRGIGSIR